LSSASVVPGLASLEKRVSAKREVRLAVADERDISTITDGKTLVVCLWHCTGANILARFTEVLRDFDTAARRDRRSHRNSSNAAMIGER